MNKQRFSVEHLLDIRTVAGQMPFHLSPDGRWLSVSIQSNRRQEAIAQERFFTGNGVPVEYIGSRLIVLDTATGSAKEPFPKASESWGGQWSPDGKCLAAFVQDGGQVVLGIWEAESGHIRLFPEARTHALCGAEVPLWTPDGAKVIVKLCTLDDTTQDVAEGEPPVTVQSYNPDSDVWTESVAWRMPSVRGKYLGYRDRHIGDVGLVDLKTGAAERMTEGWMWIVARIAPDGRSLAVFRHIDVVEEENQLYVDLMVLPLDGAAPYAVAKRIPKPWVPLGLAWSPDSRYIAYSSGKMSNQLFVADAGGSEEARELTACGGSGAGFYGTPQWSLDGRSIYSAGWGNIWEFAKDASSVRQITDGSTHSVNFCCQPESSAANGKSLLAVMRDKKTACDSLAWIDLTKGAVDLLFEFGESRVDRPTYTEAATDGSAFYFLTNGSKLLGEICVARGDHQGSTVRPLYVLNPALANIEFGRTQPIQYRDFEGKPRSAVLILPPGHAEGKPVPMIVFAYAGTNHSQWVGTFDGQSQLLAASGYATLYLDMPVDRPDRLRSLSGLVCPAINRAVELGFADPARTGLYGHSYGSWAAMGLLCQTSIFRAAVVSAPMGINMTSMFSIAPEWCERGQARMGGSPWERRDAYIENSPFFYLDRVNTPLLVAYGSEDTLATAQAQEILVGLRRLKRRVELRKYNGEGHWPGRWSERNVRDFYHSVINWYDTYLQPAQNG